MSQKEDFSKILRLDSKDKTKVITREGKSIEFKESFNWGSKDKYAKTMAGFANTNGGYLIFGVANSPRVFAGLTNDNFENQDDAIISGYLNSLFSPEIRFDRFVWTLSGKKIGAIYVHENLEKPVIAIKNDQEVKEADIYYRYSARTERIKFPELKSMVGATVEKERYSWMNLFKKASKIGVGNVALMDLKGGRIEGKGGTFVIDEKLLDRLNFINEGFVSKSGKPTLKVIGEVKPILYGPGKKGGKGTEFSLTDNPHAPMVRITEEDFRKKFPLDYMSLISILRRRYINFKTDKNFQELRKKLIQKPGISMVRFLDPGNPKGAEKRFYSKEIIHLFDKHYKKSK